MTEEKKTEDSKISGRGFLAIGVIILCILAIGWLFGSYGPKFGGEAGPDVTLSANSLKTVSGLEKPVIERVPVTETENATAKAITALGRRGKVQVTDVSIDIVETLETKLLINEVNTSVNRPTETVKVDGATVTFGNQTIKTEKIQPVEIIEVRRNVTKT